MPATKAIANYISKINALVVDKTSAFKNAQGIDINGANEALENALSQYSRHRKLYAVTEISATGTRLYVLPTGWVDELSDSDYKIEYPVDDSSEIPQFLDGAMCILYPTPTGIMLRFRATSATNYLPASGEKFRVHYAINRVITGKTNNVPDVDFIPVCKLAARELCIMIGTRLIQNAGGTTSADTVDYQSKGNLFLQFAGEFYKEYKEAVLPAPEDLKGGFIIGEFETDGLHREENPLYPRDNSNRQNTDI